MLEIKKIKKSYKTGNFVQHALNEVNIRFRKEEFVSILGPSGSGKTTFLNIVGGLDRYDSGDLIIKGKSTKKFKDKDWDAYRNKSIGFIFQSYNLISHISVLDNVCMGMTLSGKSRRYRIRKAKELLKKVGLSDHIHKKPNQLSGGQMQRVAIARALANDPEIILADEPTGALDTKTSKQIMELIKEISKGKLVIMVTHNPELAQNYSDRIIKMQDGKIIDDSKPLTDEEIDETYKLKKTKMSFITALTLSLNNIKTKKGRTLLTSFASSIGIIGIALILSLSNGFDKQIESFEHDASDAMPIMINLEKLDLSKEAISSAMGEVDEKDKFTNKKEIKIRKETFNNVEMNKLDDEFIQYLKNMDNKLVSSVMVSKGINYNIIQKNGNKYELNLNAKNHIVTFPTKDFDDYTQTGFVNDYYDLIYGKKSKAYDEATIIVAEDNSLNESIANILGLNGKKVSFDNVIGSTFKIVNNNDLYSNMGQYFTIKNTDEQMYNNPNNIEVKITGIIRLKKDKSSIATSSGNGIVITNELQDKIIENNKNSDIVKTQTNADYNVLTGEKIDMDSDSGKLTKQYLMQSFGGESYPNSISIYPKNFDSKEKIIDYLDKYNKDKKNKDKISYIDQAQLLTDISGGIMDGISVVLIAFSSISLIVSSIMLGIITYISVLERTKEIGILRGLGARKKDIKRVFNAETFIIGSASGILGIIIAYLLIIPINKLLYNLTDLKNVAVLNPIHALILIAISITLTLIGGSIPARIASKKDPVIALRTE